MISFDENTIVLDTDMGLLTIKERPPCEQAEPGKGEIDALRAGQTALVRFFQRAARRAGSFWRNCLNNSMLVAGLLQTCCADHVAYRIGKAKNPISEANSE